MEKSYNKMSVGQWILRMVHGAFIGVGSILPGVSGSVFSVLFGIYRPMMALLAHPFRAFKTYYRLFIPIVIGFLLGFVGLAKLLGMLFKTAPTLSACAFVGLIAGMIPAVYKDSGKQGRSKSSWTAFAVSFAVLLGFFMFLFIKNGNELKVAAEPEVAETMVQWVLNSGMTWKEHVAIIGRYFFCGVVWGFTFVLPGLSSSSILLFLGLYGSMTDGIGALDPGVVIPLFVGIAFIALAFARPVNWLLEKHYAILSHIILGVATASTVMLAYSLLPFADARETLFGIALILAGIAGAVFLDRFGEKVMAKQSE